MNIEHIILITDPLGSVRKTIYLYFSAYSEQAYFLTVCFILRFLFSCGLNYRIKF